MIEFVPALPFNDARCEEQSCKADSFSSRSQARGRHEDRGGGARRGIDMQRLDGFSGLANHPLASPAAAGPPAPARTRARTQALE